MMDKNTLFTALLSLLSLLSLVDAFTPPSRTSLFCPSSFSKVRYPLVEGSALMMTASGKKRRRRKQPPGSSTSEAPSNASPSSPEAVPGDMTLPTTDDIDENEEIDVAELADIANFKFEPKKEEKAPDSQTPQDGEPIPLPDIKQALQKKALEELAKAEEEEKKENQVKIDRRDKKAMIRLLEQQPYADADDSFFEEEEYNTVSALLGERAKPFLGIPTGPLQVGHTIGALVIVLMAFVEYPGFPLTNLPTPLRGALQGGLGTVYLINTLLAVVAVFKAGERGQPALLWVAKTFTVGGLAYDQLTQLPTLEQIEKAKARKGARALKNKKR